MLTADLQGLTSSVCAVQDVLPTKEGGNIRTRSEHS